MIDFNKYFIVGTNNNALHDTMNGMVVGELIRCKDCKYWMKTKKQCGYTYLLPQFNDDEYCSRAERKEE